MLAVPDPPSAGDLVERAWSVVQPLVTLKPDEREYISAIHRGESRLDLLLPDDPDAARRIAEHPAIQWKLLNVRRHLAK
jgi:hypothetical protein